ncbi:MAG: hypothetical protein U9R74_05605 [Pseudomonadota bacterium]|nr:hypothetical protein [Pseudomonadota bacterium]
MAALLTQPGAAQAEESSGLRGGDCVETPELRFCIRPNTPRQMAAFFEARGFPGPALKEISIDCFITVGIENLSDRIVWLEPAHWKIRTEDTALDRLTPDSWSRRWAALGIPEGNRATFGWTLLPETRDLRPSEPVGGNIVLPRVPGPFSLEANFSTGAKRDGEPIHIRYDEVRCARDAE